MNIYETHSTLNQATFSMNKFKSRAQTNKMLMSPAYGVSAGNGANSLVSKDG